MRLGPVRVAWLDQTPAGPAHAKMIREQRLTVQRLQGYVTEPPRARVQRSFGPYDTRSRAKPAASPAFVPPTLADLDVRHAGDGWLLFSKCIAALTLVVCVAVTVVWMTGSAQSTLDSPIGQPHQQTQGFINAQDHAHGTYFQGAAVICVTVEQGQWVEVPVTLLSADALAAINTYQLPWKAKVGDSC